MYLLYSNGKFSCQDVTERSIDDLQNGNGPIMEIICTPTFKGKPNVLAASAVEYLNEKFQVERHFNTIYVADTESLAEGQCVSRVVFQMCWAGY